MPIARIITSMPEFSGGLVRDLNSRGFEVHVISPEQTPSGNADLEIRLDAVSRTVGAEVSPAEIPTLAAAEAALKLAESGLLQPAAPPQAAPTQEDIWTMLASFDGDAATQEIATEATNDVITDIITSDSITSKEGPDETASPEVIAAMHSLGENAQPPVEIADNVPSVTQNVVAPAGRELRDSLQIDPELVRSMFNFSYSSENPPADQETSITSSHSSWQGSELRKTNLRSWDSRSSGVRAAAAGCAALIILMVLVFGYRHAKAVNSLSQETRTAVPVHTAAHGAGSTAENAAQPTVPIKPAVLVSSAGSPSKTARHLPETDTAVAEDTVRYGNAKKAAEAPSTKTSAIRYYSDMD
jgi:hypothetical protein